jgi:predicted esterase
MNNLLKILAPSILSLVLLSGCGGDSLDNREPAEVTETEAPVHTLGGDAFVRDWLIAGPFPNPEVEKPLPDGSHYLGYSKDYLAPLGGEAEAILSAGITVPYESEYGTQRTTKVFQGSAGESGVVNLDKLFRNMDYKAVYAFCYLRSDREQAVQCYFGSNDDAKVWVNGNPVHEVAAGRSCAPRQDSFTFELHEGLNPLLVKVCERTGAWAFVLEALSMESLALLKERLLAKALRQLQDCELYRKDGKGLEFSLLEGKFPEVGWKNPFRVEKLLGEFPLDIRWYDADLNEAAVPREPGLYTAVAEGSSPDGFHIRRSIVLHCRAGKIDQQSGIRHGSPEKKSGGDAASKKNWKVSLDKISTGAGKSFLKLLDQNTQNALEITSLTEMKPLSVKPSAPSNGKHAQSFVRTVSRNENCLYWLHLPEGYGEKKQLWPMILYLHPSSLQGHDLTMVRTEIPPESWDKGKDFPFVVVTPQCPETYDAWSNELLTDLLDEIISRYDVDHQRVYLTGVSLGGRGTWSLACEHPERFAAIIPVCGSYSHPEKARNLKNVPVWAFHGAKDRVVPITAAKIMTEEIKKYGGDARLTVYPDAGHRISGTTYNNLEIYDWLLAHSKAR